MSLRKAVEEIHLLRCSLLPGELLEFTAQAVLWEGLLDAYALDPDGEITSSSEPQSAHFQVKVEASDIWFNAELSADYCIGGGQELPKVWVQGYNLGRAEQERWQEIVADAIRTIWTQGSKYPTFETISFHLLPQLHVYLEQKAQQRETAVTTEVSASSSRGNSPSLHYHALFVSHHLKSKQKRRALSQWSHELSLSAKVGQPGVIYCQGPQENVEGFVERVKSMQWLALRLRFLEVAPPHVSQQSIQYGRWAEFEKVGQVVEEMRRLGREHVVLNMGIGSAKVSN